MDFKMEFIHKATAQACQDIEKPDDRLITYRDPYRRWVRLVLIAVVAALLVAATVVMAVRIPEFQTEKRTFSSKHATRELQQLLNDAVKKQETINCPCRYQALSWCNITTFHIYVADEKAAFVEAINITKNGFKEAYPKICGEDPNSLIPAICESVLSSVMNSDDSRTSLMTANALTSPYLLYTEIKMRMETNAYEESNTYNYLELMNKTAAFNYSDGLTRFVRNMADQLLLNISSSAEDFWNASAVTREMYPVIPFGFGMDVNWTAYLQNCYPAFCDIEFKVSVLSRMLRAMGQVGGITTVISLALQFLIWPLLRKALFDPSLKATS